MDDLDFFRLGSTVYPQPVAVACGRILRTRTQSERLDAILRTGEVLTRYLAVLSLASLTAQTSQPPELPDSLTDFNRNLSWGHYLTVARTVAKQKKLEHPLARQIRDSVKRGKSAPNGLDLLDQLLVIRNKIGHDVQHVSAAAAETIFRQESPQQTLCDALTASAPLLELPLFVVEEQRYASRQFIARRLLLMGESDNPLPEEIVLKHGLDHTGKPYLGLPGGVLSLWPWLQWELTTQRKTYAVQIVHAITERSVKYISLFGDHYEENSSLVSHVHNLLTGEQVHAMESDVAAPQHDLAVEWRRRLLNIRDSLNIVDGRIPWDQLDSDTVVWYAEHLDAPDNRGSPQIKIQTLLLDGRDSVTTNELLQLKLLFGTAAAIRTTINRNMLDCRARKDSSNPRWDERVESSDNIILSLRAAIAFFSRHVGIDGVTLDGLVATSGQADYLAMREGLVNLFIHQDYGDAGTTAQLEISEHRAVFFNAGRSLVSDEALADGGKSQSRNPLICRALRLIGFAELAGSGLRTIHYAWRSAGRKPPRIVSDAAANTFTVILDWRPQPQVRDTFWNNKLGVSVSPSQSQLLNILAASGPVTLGELASASGMPHDDVLNDVKYLRLQGLVQTESETHRLSEHLIPLLGDLGQTG